jgi:hypothetical protein
MRYDLETSLLPASVAEGERAVRVPFDALPDRGLLLFDEGVSDFWFELNPRRDAELFLRNAHFGCMGEACSRLVTRAYSRGWPFPRPAHSRRS